MLVVVCIFCLADCFIMRLLFICKWCHAWFSMLHFPSIWGVFTIDMTPLKIEVLIRWLNVFPLESWPWMGGWCSWRRMRAWRHSWMEINRRVAPWRIKLTGCLKILIRFGLFHSFRCRCDPFFFLTSAFIIYSGYFSFKNTICNI